MQDGGIKTATFELRMLLERFANGKGTNMIFDAANTLMSANQETRYTIKGDVKM